MTRAIPLAIAIALGFGASTRADNALFNPEFDSGPGPDWVSGVANPLALVEDSDGCIASSSVRVTSLEDVPHMASIQQCVPVIAGQTVRARARMSVVSGVGTHVDFLLRFSSAADCSIDGEQVFVAAVPVTTAWAEIQTAEITVPEGEEYASFWIMASRVASTFELLVDRAYLGPSDLIFGEDQEIAEPCRWSLQFP